MYDRYIEVDSSVKIDTINNIFQLKRKLRTDFSFRWDFAQYAMTRPYSWYFNNPRLDGIWRPYNRFDVWFHSHQFWYDWAFNYPWYGYDHPWWVRNHRYYNWYYPHPQGWYGWNHYSYSWYNEPLIASNNNYSFVNGRRGSRYNDFLIGNSNIEQDTNRRRGNRVYPNKPNNVINDVIRWSNDNNIRINVNSNPNRVDSNNNVVIPNRPNNNNNNWNSKPRVPNNNFNNGRPPVNNFNSNPPVNINRGGNVGGSSRGSVSGGSSSSSSGRRGGN
tara:strand:- start:2131 stop:2952 length:822 start_codon:yes stop_codon:yes gene_type:complete